jgi:N-acetylmuramic acid 6-phosphate (MurNAc-6-P) etherase
MDSNAPRLSSSHALSLTTIAGKPAPTHAAPHEMAQAAIAGGCQAILKSAISSDVRADFSMPTGSQTCL